MMLYRKDLLGDRGCEIARRRSFGAWFRRVVLRRPPKWANHIATYSACDRAELEEKMRVAFTKMELKHLIYCSPETLREIEERGLI